jgi:hypothetical protein
MNDTPPDAPTNEELSHAKDGQPVCGDCVHCLPGPDTQNDIMARACYRFPPIPLLAPTNKGPGLASVRPLIRVDTWACGEYETEEDAP